MRKVLMCFLLSFFVMGCADLQGSGLSAVFVKKDLESIFKKTKILKVRESEIKGLWEVYVGSKDNVNVIYYYPEKKLLLFGEIWDINGKNLTGEKRELFLRQIQGNLEVK